MSVLKVGDIVARKSYGGDLHFKIINIRMKDDGTKVYELRGLIYRIMADSHGEDLVIQDHRFIRGHIQKSLVHAGFFRLNSNFPGTALFSRLRGRAGTILHLDSSSDYLDMCIKYYRQANIRIIGKVVPESEQPGRVRSLLENTNADILVVTGHDGMKKNPINPNSLDNYTNSRYYIESVREARKYQPSFDKLCIFAGACQSYFEGIMGAGSNFASSPGRILIHALDPAKVGDKVALTDNRSAVTPDQIAAITESGSQGIGGIRTKGHYVG